MIDLNLLLYAYDETAPLHPIARRWLTAEFVSARPTGIAGATVVSFVRLVTDSRVFSIPMKIEEACSIVESWFALPDVHMLGPTERHWSIFAELARRSQASAALISDVDVAATAIEHGGTVCTHDQDFKRFDGLRVEFPLIGS